MSKHSHGIAAALCVVMLLSLFVSSAYIVHEAAHPHACTGDHCPVCQFIAQIEQVCRGFGMGLLALVLACLVLFARRERRIPAVCVPALCTPVGRNIRLND